MREHWLPGQFGQRFHEKELRLSPGGLARFNAVSEDRRIVASITTSKATTAGGKYGVGKMMKLRSDMLFLMLSQVERCYIVLTERDMYDQCLKEQDRGRVPECVSFCYAEIPPALRERLDRSRRIASEEVSPS